MIEVLVEKMVVMTVVTQVSSIFLKAGWETYLKELYCLKVVGYRQKPQTEFESQFCYSYRVTGTPLPQFPYT